MAPTINNRIDKLFSLPSILSYYVYILYILVYRIVYRKVCTYKRYMQIHKDPHSS